MASGIVKWYNPVKGFGFIRRDGGFADIYFHRSDWERSIDQNLTDGRRVTFDIGQDLSQREVATNLEMI